MSEEETIRPDQIVKHWEQGTSHCEGCSRRDTDGVTSPYFGFGKFPAKIVFIGEAPGGTSDGSSNNLEIDYRVWKDYGEVEEEAGEKRRKTAEDFTLSVSDMGSSHYKELEPFFKAVSREFGDEASWYFTNVAKCSDIWKDEDNRNKTLNDSGKDDCSGYLLPELRAADPDGIVIFSNGVSHLTSVLSLLGASSVPDAGSVTDYVLDMEYISGNSPFRQYYSEPLDAHIVASYHYKQGYTTTSDYIGSGKIRQQDIGAPNDQYNSEAITPRPMYADGVMQALREAIESK